MMHRLDVEPFAQAGITARPARPNRDGSDSSSSNCLSGHQESSRPFAEFVLRWLRRNPLANDDREAVITWDSGQFHQQDGKIVGLLDVEIGHIGDPMMDLAALPGRDTYLDYGNLRALCARYEELGGVRGRPRCCRLLRDRVHAHRPAVVPLGAEQSDAEPPIEPMTTSSIATSRPTAWLGTSNSSTPPVTRSSRRISTTSSRCSVIAHSTGAREKPSSSSSCSSTMDRSTSSCCRFCTDGNVGGGTSSALPVRASPRRARSSGSRAPTS